MQLASAVVSVAALIVACVSLWRTHLATFSPRLAVGRLSLFADQTTLDREWWYVPRVVVAVNVTNAGARAGVITDARVVARYPDHPVDDAHEIFRLNGELDPAKYHTLKCHKDLFREAYRGDGRDLAHCPTLDPATPRQRRFCVARAFQRLIVQLRARRPTTDQGNDGRTSLANNRICARISSTVLPTNSNAVRCSTPARA